MYLDPEDQCWVCFMCGRRLDAEKARPTARADFDDLGQGPAHGLAS